jgi:hypothetical protein
MLSVTAMLASATIGSGCGLDNDQAGDDTADDTNLPHLDTTAMTSDFGCQRGWRQICLVNGSQDCITSSGVGNQLTLAQYAFGKHWKIHCLNSSGTIVQLSNTSYTQCMRARTDNSVEIDGAACSSSDGRETWHLVVNSTQTGFTLQNEGSGGFLITTNDNVNDKLWTGSKNGNWYTWMFPI